MSSPPLARSVKKHAASAAPPARALRSAQRPAALRGGNPPPVPAEASPATADAGAEIGAWFDVGGRRIPIGSGPEIIAARQEARRLAIRIGFSPSESTLIATAISELARNIVAYARVGEITLAPVRDGARQGLGIIARDHGPGIRELRLAVQDGFSTSHGLGLGLPGVRRLMDEFEIDSEFGKGTTVRVAKWLTEPKCR